MLITKIARGLFPGKHDRGVTDWSYGARVQAIAAELVRRYGSQVLAGPFAGMVLPSPAGQAAYLPQLLGSYQEELQPFLHIIQQVCYARIVSAACGDGYLAVGLARTCRSARVFAFDESPAARAACRELAQLNGVTERVEVGGNLDADTLNHLAGQHTLLLSELKYSQFVDGQSGLLHPARVLGLRDMDLLLVLHDYLDRNLLTEVKTRFADTHMIEIVSSARRDPQNYPALHFLDPRDQQTALAEHHPGKQTFALLTAHNSPVYQLYQTTGRNQARHL